MTRVSFNVSPTIKNIIGKDLIHSDFVAIIELIKNSKDAEASRVNVFFESEAILNEESMIYVVDDGTGMSFDDIKGKWLNIAYSAKKNVKNKKYAGNKGVGRFSCDRLGQKLNLYTKTANTSEILHLYIDWTAFETTRQKRKISDIKLDITPITPQKFYEQTGLNKFSHGTVLKITELREPWPTKKLKKLFEELEKFAPSIDNDFAVYVHTKNSNEIIQSKQGQAISSNILSELAFKTSYIQSSIDKSGKYIFTTLFHQGAEVLRYKVENPYATLKNIRVEIHFIDTLARSYFTRQFGLKLVEYGSIFLFYNGFRVSPYGNVGNDWLSLDQRKAQGYSRYFGTRELFGRITIEDSDDAFDVLTNREGLAYNTAFQELISPDEEIRITTGKKNAQFDYGYITNIIRQLEFFVVGVSGWNKIIDLQANGEGKRKVISDGDILKDPQRYALFSVDSTRALTIKDKLLKSSWNITRIKINSEIIKNLASIAEEKYKNFLYDFVEQIQDKEYKDLLLAEKKSLKYILLESKKRIQFEQEQRQIVEKSLAEKESKLVEAQSKLVHIKKEVAKQTQVAEQNIGENIFLRASSNRDTDSLMNLMHKIIDDTLIIDRNVKYYAKKRNQGRSLSENELDDLLFALEERTRSILKVAQFATLRNYKMATGFASINVAKYIYDYVKMIHNEKIYRIVITVEKDKSCFEIENKKVRPLNLSIMVDNIINNAIKAKSKNITISIRKNSKDLVITFSDDGVGLSPKADPTRIFDKGYTFTNGSGLGLYFVKTFIEEELGGTISVQQSLVGLTLEVIIPCA